MTGIDISKWQGEIDWPQVKAAGIEFAIIKAGGSDAGFYKDPYFERNYAGATAAGIPVGAYYYVGTGFGGAENGRADAVRFEQYLKGKRFAFPVFLDCEKVARSITKEQCTEAAIAFCEYLEGAGYFVGIYGAEIAVFKDLLGDVSRFTAWVANYSRRPEMEHTIWQRTDKGSVPGIEGNVDIDECYTDFPKIIEGLGLNGFQTAAPPDGNGEEIRRELREILGQLEDAADRLRALTE